MTIRIKSIW